MATRKEIHFDFDTKKLQELYPQAEKGLWTNAYNDFRVYLELSGFVHTQGSGYESVKGIKFYDVANIVGDFAFENPWFLPCLKTATTTEIKKQHNLVEMIVEQQKEEIFEIESPTEETGQAKRDTENQPKTSFDWQDKGKTKSRPETR